MQILGKPSRGAGIPEDGIDVLVGVGQHAIRAVKGFNGHYGSANRSQQLRLKVLSFVA